MSPLAVDCVIKVGGGVLARADTFDAVMAEISLASREAALLVPGGGPFADTVRDVDRQVGLSDDAAHWMAILAMDQYAHLIASRLPNGEVVCGPDEIESALEATPHSRSGSVSVAARRRSSAAFVGRDERQHCGMGCRTGWR